MSHGRAAIHWTEGGERQGCEAWRYLAGTGGQPVCIGEHMESPLPYPEGSASTVSERAVSWFAYR